MAVTICSLVVSTLLVVLGKEFGLQQSCAQKMDVDFNAPSEEIVYPERIDHARDRRDVSKENKDHHDDKAKYKVQAFGRSFIVDITRNKLMIPEGFFIRSFSKEGKQILEKSTVESCQYQGHVEGQPASTVVLDICHGLSGLIEDKNGRFAIVPIHSKGFNAHKITRIQGPKTFSTEEEFSCGTTSKNDTRNMEKKVDNKRPRRSIDSLFRSHIQVKKTRYTEVIIIVDKAIYDKYGSNKTEMKQRIFRLINAVDMIYQKINIRIILKALEIWTEKDKVAFNKKAGKDLNNLQKYREKHVARYKCDVLQLLRGKEWDDHGGMAYMGEMCTIRSTGVVGWNDWSLLGPWLALAHEMGHNFGFDHDDLKKCKCLTPRGCIMRTFKTRIPGFSDCNLRDLRKIDDSCLYNIPVKSLIVRCGNGIKEGNEQCDCGTPENCAVVDPCCNPKTCRLHASSQCSDLHDKCCRQCQYAPAGSICRLSQGQCDLPELCTGKSGQCPSDDYKRHGTPCHFYDFELIGNSVDSRIKMTRLPTRIKARYVRIVPQHWQNDICMRTEIYGCATLSSPNAATPLRSDNNLCVEANYGICDSNDVSELVFKQSDDCTTVNNMQFRMTSEGVLIHQCTGNMVCPRDSKVKHGTKLVVKKSCRKQSAKFRRVGKSLKHIQSGFCVHPFNGLAQDDVPLVLWPGCKGNRIALTFVKTDCEKALGMESGGIRNERIKATSYRKNKEALHARLNGFNGWCAGKRNKEQHLQIDLGKVKFVSAVATEGMFDGRRVTGYHLYYSKNGQQWKAYLGRKKIRNNSYCFKGKCSATRNSQCRDLWSATSASASKACYVKYNTQDTRYGTCHPARSQSCRPKDAMCGQLQCLDKTRLNPTVDYGLSYKRVLLAGKKQCSLAVRKTGLGMVANGTKCGINKMCVNFKCRSVLLLDTQPCPRVNGLECAGNGFCTANGKCHCNEGYDPLTSCSAVMSIDDGGWGLWSSWSRCSCVCGRGTQKRHRFCDTPVPSVGGRKCSGDRIQTKYCNLQKCPVAHSCRHLQAIGRQRGVNYPSGVYIINPGDQGSVKTYCDMTRNGGGWTLLVTSHTNTWTPANVRRRATNNPSLNRDFSVLFVANSIKNSVNVRGNSFEYRIEAQEFGRWGGIWKAPRTYSFTATNNQQTRVKLIQKFDKWKYEDFGIEERMPWIYGGRLTTSANATKYAFGSITSNIKRFYPAPWINAKENEQHPTNIWYWMREGEFQDPRSCMELQLLGLQSSIPQSNGFHTLKLRGQKVKTYCDFTSDGGGWTLLVTSASRTGWTRRTLAKRNVNRPSLYRDFSILGLTNHIIRNQHFQYKIEDDTKKWGGIFEAEQGQSFLSTSNAQTRIKVLKKHGNWDENSNLGQRVPYTKGPTLLLTTAVQSQDNSGTIISSSAEGIYIPNKMERPSALRIWVREGTWRSCNEIKRQTRLPGKQVSLEDGAYMIKNTSYQYLPVICDMNSDGGAWTLLVTSATNGWLPSQVKHRNTNRPSLTQDYSILELGDQIKGLSGGKTFLYKLEAHQHGRWGGVWRAPMRYSFVATDNGQTNVSLVKKYDQWFYNWANSLEKRMPWIGQRNGLLTTSTHCDYYEWGTIISDQTKNKPAPWIDFFMINPGVIWYWVNEDDCEPNASPVDGGLSPWSAWSKCSPLCSSNGFQTRRRSCSNPVPRCGGRSCALADLIPEKRRCRFCPKSPIRGRNNLCIQPSTANCNPPDNTRLVYKQNTNDCDHDYMDFLYDIDGMLMHLCSGKYVCPRGGKAGYGTPLVLSSSCKRSYTMFEITKDKVLRHKQSRKCIHPNMGNPTEGVHLVTWAGCRSPGRKLMLELFKLQDDQDIFHTARSLLKTTAPTSVVPTARVIDSPIRSHGGFCLLPRTADCSPPDGTEIVYSGVGGSNVHCSRTYMLFTLTANGQLKHTCSGKYLCPDPDYVDLDGSLFNGTPAVLKDKCTVVQAKYTRTSAKSLRHSPSGFCVHPASGTPTSGTKAVFWSQCDLKRLTLDFYNLSD